MPDLEIPCPSCGRINQLHTSTTNRNARPSDGDVSLCWACWAPALYETTPLGVLTLRQPTTVEMNELQRDPDLAAALDAARRHSTPSAAAEAALTEREARRG